MFSLAVLTDSVRVHPKTLQSSLLSAVTEALNGSFCNRVIGEVGLGISVFDVLEVEDPYVHPGESHAFIKGIINECAELFLRYPPLYYSKI